MKRAGKVLLAVFLLSFLGWFFLTTRPTTPEVARTAREAEAVKTNVGVNLDARSSAISSSTNSSANSEPLIGETILRGYATSASTPENDLTLMSHLMDNFLLLVKSAADRPMSANEDWATALRGKNPAHERFLPDQHIALNAAGQLVDRWQTPLFFHALGGRRFEIRSAGPDKKMWTDDDLHRNADGSFRRGANLNAASLFDSASPHSGH